LPGRERPAARGEQPAGVVMHYVVSSTADREGGVLPCLRVVVPDAVAPSVDVEQDRLHG
jgi:hypothetical protein